MGSASLFVKTPRRSALTNGLSSGANHNQNDRGNCLKECPAPLPCVPQDSDELPASLNCVLATQGTRLGWFLSPTLTPVAAAKSTKWIGSCGTPSGKQKVCAWGRVGAGRGSGGCNKAEAKETHRTCVIVGPCEGSPLNCQLGMVGGLIDGAWKDIKNRGTFL